MSTASNQAYEEGREAWASGYREQKALDYTAAYTAPSP